MSPKTWSYVRFSLMMYSTCLKTDGSPCRSGTGRGARIGRGGARALIDSVRRLFSRTVCVCVGQFIVCRAA